MVKEIVYFAFGTVKNSSGYQIRYLKGTIEKDISQYTDRKGMPNGHIERCTFPYKNQEYGLLAIYDKITPSDQKETRGAYIAVGSAFPLDGTITENHFIKIYLELESIRRDLLSKRRSNNAFPLDFNIEKYNYSVETREYYDDLLEFFKLEEPCSPNKPGKDESRNIQHLKRKINALETELDEKFNQYSQQINEQDRRILYLENIVKESHQRKAANSSSKKNNNEVSPAKKKHSLGIIEILAGIIVFIITIAIIMYFPEGKKEDKTTPKVEIPNESKTPSITDDRLRIENP